MSAEKSKYECISCKASGIYSGGCESEGVGVICLQCEGNGYKEASAQDFIGGSIPIFYKPFTEKKRRDDIRVVHFRMEYEEFLKLPQRQQKLLYTYTR